MNSKTIVKILIAVAVVAGAIFLLTHFPVKAKLTEFNDYVKSLGALGVVVFVLGYAIAALLFPASILTLGAGATFGPWLGTAAVSVGSTLCACLAFMIGRTVARASIQKKMASFPKFKAVESAVAKQGFKIVLLTRLSPAFPFTWMNYAYGVTEVKFRDYALASWLGMLPGTFAYVYLGYAAKQAGDAATSGGSGSSVLVTILKVAVVVVPALVVTAIIAKTAKKALAEASGETAVPPAPPVTTH